MCFCIGRGCLTVGWMRVDHVFLYWEGLSYCVVDETVDHVFLYWERSWGRGCLTVGWMRVDHVFLY